MSGAWVRATYLAGGTTYLNLDHVVQMELHGPNQDYTTITLTPGAKTIEVRESPDNLLEQIEERVLHLARGARRSGIAGCACCYFLRRLTRRLRSRRKGLAVSQS
jgi:uncharacterized protein YlzI (FlbEa/FlbD family)